MRGLGTVMGSDLSDGLCVEDGGVTYDDQVHAEEEVEDEETAKRAICPVI